MTHKLAIVTATTNLLRSAACQISWTEYASGPIAQFVVVNGVPAMGTEQWRCETGSAGKTWMYATPDYLGVVPAFAIGVRAALELSDATIIACLHDDLEITEPGWDELIKRVFQICPKAGLVGLGGATGLGHDRIYQIPYEPMQLARHGFMSNMRDAEAHGGRTNVYQPVAVLDGFSQIGSRRFWEGYTRQNNWEMRREQAMGVPPGNLFELMQTWGIVHHAYDAALGCFAKRLGYQVWLAPLACHHHGGQTAVGDPGYHQWAQQQAEGGDAGFWQHAHGVVYHEFKDVLPIRV